MSSEQIIQQAAQWLTRLHDEAVTDADRQAFNAWRQADPRHEVAIERMSALWGSLDALPAKPARIALNRAFTPRPRRGAQVVGLLGVVLCGWLGLQHLPIWMADQRTGIGERRQIALEDGSQLQLNSNSAVDVKFDGHQRVIELLQGELWVDVAKDAQRPFVVRTDQGTATALGTRYLVKRAAGHGKGQGLGAFEVDRQIAAEHAAAQFQADKGMPCHSTMLRRSSRLEITQEISQSSSSLCQRCSKSARQ